MPSCIALLNGCKTFIMAFYCPGRVSLTIVVVVPALHVVVVVVSVLHVVVVAVRFVAVIMGDSKMAALLAIGNGHRNVKRAFAARCQRRRRRHI